MKEIKLKTPVNITQLKKLKVGTKVLISGIIYTARDMAHKKLIEEKRKKIDLSGQIIYYTGPSPAKTDQIIGSIGPTTSTRMDEYTDAIIKKYSPIAFIGKGNRSKKSIETMKGKCVYFCAIGGAGAYISKHIKKAEIVAYRDLGTEAIYKLEVDNFPVITAIDMKGCSIYG